MALIRVGAIRIKTIMKEVMAIEEEVERVKITTIRRVWQQWLGGRRGSEIIYPW